jgi:hypothetical protein
MDPLDLDIFRKRDVDSKKKAPNMFPIIDLNSSFYGMSKKTKRKAPASPTDDILKVADFAVKASVAVALTSAVIGTTARALNR